MRTMGTGAVLKDLIDQIWFVESPEQREVCLRSTHRLDGQRGTRARGASIL